MDAVYLRKADRAGDELGIGAYAHLSRVPFRPVFKVDPQYAVVVFKGSGDPYLKDGSAWNSWEAASDSFDKGKQIIDMQEGTAIVLAVVLEAAAAMGGVIVGGSILGVYPEDAGRWPKDGTGKGVPTVKDVFAYLSLCSVVETALREAMVPAKK